MESTVRFEMRIGMLVMAGLFAVVALILLSDRVTLQNNYSVAVYLDDAAGLNVGSPVKLSGITIGSVETIRTTDDSRGTILATISVREHFDIDQRAQLENKSAGIFGDNFLAFTPPAGLSGPALPKDGSAAVVATTDFFDRATQQIQDVLDGLANVFDHRGRNDMKRILAGSADLVEEATLLTNQLRVQTAELDVLIRDGNSLVTELRTTQADLASDISKTLAEADQTMATVRQTTATLGADLHALHNDATRIMASAANLVGNADRVMAAGDEQLIQAMAQLQGVTASVQRLLADVEAGRGVIGQLLRSDALARDLNETALTATQVAARISDSPEILVWGSSNEERDAARTALERSKLRRSFMAGYGQQTPVTKDLASDQQAEIQDQAVDQPLAD